MKFLSIGLDLSICNTGVAIIERDGETEKSTTYLVKSKPPQEKTHAAEAIRLLKISADVMAIVEKYDIKKSKTLFTIEGFAFHERNSSSLLQLAGLGYLIRVFLAEHLHSFVVVQPTTLKKFITGKGNAPKDNVMLDILQRYQKYITDNNEADAYVLSRIGMDLMISPLDIPKYQKEVLDLLKTQL